MPAAAPETPTNDPLPPPAMDAAQRQERLSVLARADCGRLEAFWSALPRRPSYRLLKRPETGLVMVRGRAGGTGRAFNLGEMTATRCVVELDGGEIGVGYIAGRDARKAELVALIDALAQRDGHGNRIEADLVAPARHALAAARAVRAAKVAATKVDFFTLVRGED